MVKLYSRYVSGNELTAGIITGSATGISGLNPVVDRLNRVSLPVGSYMNVGSVWCLSGTTGSSTLIRASDTDRISLLIFNNDSTGSTVYIGPSGVVIQSGTSWGYPPGYKLGASSFYEYLDTEEIYGLSEKTGSINIRWMEIK